MKFTLKQREIIRDLNLNKDWHILIMHGAKRSGKTVLNNMLFIKELANVKATAKRLGIDTPQYILAGFTMATLRQNIIAELENMGIKIKTDRYNNFMLMGVYVVQTSTSDISGIGRIRGMTSFGAYVNEASLCNKEVFDEIIARCSGAGSRIVCDTNPDHPEHWLLKDYINNDADPHILNYHFELDDNEFLDPDYKRNIKLSTPKGMFYDRAIKGLWVSGQGTIYSMFDKSKMSLTKAQAYGETYDRFFVGVDWGFNHPTAFTVCGYKNGTYTLIEEHSGSGKSIKHWEQVALDIENRFGRGLPFYCDTANSEHVSDLINVGINAIGANKSVMNGIEYLSSLMQNGRFFVNYDACPLFRTEIYKYVWEDKTGQPVKLNDDCMDSLRYAIYNDYLQHANEPTTIKDFKVLRKFM
nr:MAG: terminase large subunit [Caudoviricetes sp.]UYL16472.1 MAG: terminase large subunit [Caudoviricetes sp.]